MISTLSQRTRRSKLQTKKRFIGIGSRRPQRSHGAHREKDRHKLTPSGS